jgi:hypothetical protein
MPFLCKLYILRYGGSSSNLHSLLDTGVVPARLKPLDQFLWVKVRSNGIDSKLLRSQPLRSLFIGIKVVDLGLNLVAVRILVVHRSCGVVVNAPDGQVAVGLALAVR